MGGSRWSTRRLIETDTSMRQVGQAHAMSVSLTRAMLAGLAAPAVVFSLVACGDTGDEDENGGAGVPRCSDLWTEGATVPEGYEGCLNGHDLEAVLVYDCEDGRTFVAHGPGFGIVGEEAHVTPKGLDEPDVESAEYAAVFGDCMGYDDDEDEQSPAASAEPDPAPSPEGTARAQEASPAARPTPGCVTEDEFDEVELGFTVEEVERVFGSGALASDLGESRSYYSCDYQHAAIVDFSGGSLISKQWTMAG